MVGNIGPQVGTIQIVNNNTIFTEIRSLRSLLVCYNMIIFVQQSNRHLICIIIIHLHFIYIYMKTNTDLICIYEKNSILIYTYNYCIQQYTNWLLQVYLYFVISLFCCKNMDFSRIWFGCASGYKSADYTTNIKKFNQIWYL